MARRRWTYRPIDAREGETWQSKKDPDRRVVILKIDRDWDEVTLCNLKNNRRSTVYSHSLFTRYERVTDLETRKENA